MNLDGLDVSNSEICGELKHGEVEKGETKGMNEDACLVQWLLQVLLHL